jgi:hypothetical protein
VFKLISTDGGNVARPTKTARLRYDIQAETLVVDCVLDRSRHRYCFDVALGLGEVVTMDPKKSSSAVHSQRFSQLRGAATAVEISRVETLVLKKL